MERLFFQQKKLNKKTINSFYNNDLIYSKTDIGSCVMTISELLPKTKMEAILHRQRLQIISIESQ